MAGIIKDLLMRRQHGRQQKTAERCNFRNAVFATLTGIKETKMTALWLTNWNACGILYLGFWTHTASGKKASYGYVYSDVAIVLF